MFFYAERSSKNMLLRLERKNCKKEVPRLRVCVSRHLTGAGGRTRTGTVSLPVDFESTTSANSITPANVTYAIIQYGFDKIKYFLQNTKNS